MRSNGIDEKMITGDGDEYEKWVGFAKTMPLLIGNPIYHWTALELKRYFDIDTPLTEDTAKEIWDKCSELLKTSEYSAQSLIKRSNVEITAPQTTRLTICSITNSSANRVLKQRCSPPSVPISL